jgi:hypothetical protein
MAVTETIVGLWTHIVQQDEGKKEARSGLAVVERKAKARREDAKRGMQRQWGARSTIDACARELQEGDKSETRH